MGTRSLTVVKNDNGKDLLTIYRQMDGYPTGQGNDLAKFLNSRVLCNGLGAPREDGKTWANGLSCLAAQLVAELKNEPGNIYIYPNGSKDCGEEYKYIIAHDGQSFTMKAYRVSYKGVATLIYNGTAQEFNGEKLEKE